MAKIELCSQEDEFEKPKLLGDGIPSGEAVDLDNSKMVAHKTLSHCFATSSKSEMVLPTSCPQSSWQIDCNELTDFNAWKESGLSQLHWACYRGRTGIVAHLLKQQCEIHSQDDDGNTLLHLACKGGRADIVKLLIKEGSDINVQNKDGETPLNLASIHKHWIIVNYLKNVNIDETRLETALSAQLATLTDQNIANKDKPGKKRDLSKLNERLKTFTQGPQCWSRPTPSAESLAEVGFVYTGIEDCVECHACFAVITNWDDNEDPLFKHCKKNPSCPFLRAHFPSKLQEFFRQASGRYNEKYANSSARLHSFAPWHLGHIATSYQLASVGFFYTGIGDRVQCFSCGLTHDHWKSGDIPLIIHRKYSPFCRFLHELIHKGTSPPAPLPPLSSPASILDSEATSGPTSLPVRDLSLPDWANEQTRLKSFKYLPKDVPVSRGECARVGFYFVSSPDTMKCFSCGATVKGWVSGDIPVEKHREVSPQCKFLREFFPTKLERTLSTSSEDTFDPSSLPAPQFSEEDLERLYASHSKQADMRRLTTDSEPPSVTSLETGLSQLSTDERPTSYQAYPSGHSSGYYTGDTQQYLSTSYSMLSQVSRQQSYPRKRLPSYDSPTKAPDSIYSASSSYGASILRQHSDSSAYLRPKSRPTRSEYAPTPIYRPYFRPSSELVSSSILSSPKSSVSVIGGRPVLLPPSYHSSHQPQPFKGPVYSPSVSPQPFKEPIYSPPVSPQPFSSLPQTYSSTYPSTQRLTGAYVNTQQSHVDTHQTQQSYYMDTQVGIQQPYAGTSYISTSHVPQQQWHASTSQPYEVSCVDTVH